MARNITPYPVADSAVTPVTTSAFVTISSSPVIQIPANSSITVNISFNFNDLDSGYVYAVASSVNVDTLVQEGIGASALFGGSGSLNTLKILTNTTSSPVNVRIDVGAQSYFANTRTQITAFSIVTVELFAGENVSTDMIPDNNPSYPNAGAAILSNASTSAWVEIASVTTPAYPCVVALSAPSTFIAIDGTNNYPGTFTYQYLVNGVVIDENDVVYTSNDNIKTFPHLIVETSATSTVVIRVKVKTQGNGNWYLAHSTLQKIVMRLDQIGAYSSQMISSSTAVSTTDILRTPVVTTTTNNYVMAILSYTANATQSLYRKLWLPYDTIDNTNGISGGGSLDFGATEPNGRGDFVLIFKKATSTSMDFAIRQASTNISMTLRPGSGIYIMDLSAEPIPTQTYDPICWLHAS